MFPKRKERWREDNTGRMEAGKEIRGKIDEGCLRVFQEYRKIHSLGKNIGRTIIFSLQGMQDVQRP